MKKMLMMGMAVLLVLAAGCESKEAKETRLAAEAAAQAAQAAQAAMASLVTALETGDAAAFTAAVEGGMSEEDLNTVLTGLSPVTIAAALKTGADFGSHTQELAALLGEVLINAAPEQLLALSAYASPGGDFKYELNKAGNGIIISGYTGKNPILIIPAEIEGYPVVQVGGSKDRLTSTRLISVIIPKNVKTIGGAAFDKQGSLTSVTLPDGLETIMDGTWYSSYGTSYNWGAFSECSRLTSIRLPDTLKTIGDYAFWLCRKLATINIPANIQKIGEEAFSVCGELYTITIPDSLTAVNWGQYRTGAFYNSTGKLPLATRQKLKDLGYKWPL